MIFGAGSLAFRSTELDPNSLRGEELLFPGCIAEFELTADTDLLEAFCLQGGKRQRVATAIGEETFTLSTSIEFIGWDTLQFAYDELSQTSSNVVIPTVVVAEVPTSGPFTIINSDITVANEATVLVHLSERSGTNSRLFMNNVSPAAPSALNEFSVDGATNTITFDSTAAGLLVTYCYDKTCTSVETLFVESTADSLGKLLFSGIANGTEFGDGVQIVIPDLTRVTTPTLNIDGTVTTLEVEFSANALPGARKPFELYRLDSCT